jgi:hypothetical protein
MRKEYVKHIAVVANESKPKKLGKAAGWLRRNPEGLGGKILDWRAAMK